MRGVCIGDVIEPHALDGVLRGHGTLLRNESLVASRCGLVQRWNQLVLVDPLAGSYVAAVGHMVVGRVVQVEPARWLVDIRSKTLAALPLSTAGGAVHRAAEGMRASRSILAEGDLIAAEVQAVRADGYVQLHVRDALASKLPPGVLVDVPTALVPPARKHVLQWPTAGLRIVVGCNGAVWVGQEDENSSLTYEQVRAASELVCKMQTEVNKGLMLIPACMQLL